MCLIKKMIVNIKRGLFLSLITVLVPVLLVSGGQFDRDFPDFPVEYYSLKNGLRIILCSDPSLPIVSVVVAYGAGTVREKKGQAGLAYFLENLMFQGSENVGPLQHISYIQKIGGELNAQTRFEKTVFYQTIPSNQLGLALWLESDRMRSLSLSASAVEKVRGELIKEIDNRLATEPYFPSLEYFDTLLYPDYAYGHPWLSGEDIRNLTLDTIRNFYRDYYVPGNAVLCICGNIQFSKAKELITRYFGTLPPGPSFRPPDPPSFNQESDVVVRSLNPSAASPGFCLGYRFHPLQTGDYHALRILEYILLKGNTSRLVSRLVKKEMIAYSLDGWVEDRMNISALKIIALNTNEVMSQRAQRVLAAELERLKTSPVSENELNKAKRLFKADFMRQMASRVDRALFLIDLAWRGNPLDSPSAELEKYMKVESQSILSLAVRHFVPAKRVLLNMGIR